MFFSALKKTSYRSFKNKNVLLNLNLLFVMKKVRTSIYVLNRNTTFKKSYNFLWFHNQIQTRSFAISQFY